MMGGGLDEVDFFLLSFPLDQIAIGLLDSLANNSLIIHQMIME